MLFSFIYLVRTSISTLISQVVTVNKGWLYGLITLQVLSLSYNQVDYIEDDGWEFCKQVHTLNFQVRKNLNNFTFTLILL